jgi:tetratricopeptide (TPR) repeat protein
MRKLLFLFLLLGLVWSPVPAWGEDPPEDEPADEMDEGEEAEDVELEWLDDLDEAREKAKEAKKGLFVYLTPDWFTWGFCGRLEGAAYKDEDVLKYLADRFVAVRIEDKRDDRTADKLGISREGFPNIAIYDADQEYIGRVIGFGGVEPWFKQVKEVVAVGEKLSEAKQKAEEKPEEWIAVAELLMTIPDRADDALAALENVPKQKQKTKEYKAAVKRIGARADWKETEEALDALMQGVRTRDAAIERAPDALEKLDEFLKEHEGADPTLDPAVMAKKGFFLVLLGRLDEAIVIAKQLLEKFPGSDQTATLLRGLR